LEAYGPIFHYVQGTDNALTDALSRLPALGQPNVDFPFQTSSLHSPQEHLSHSEYDKANLQDHTFTACVNNEELLQCMNNFPEIEMHEPCLLDYGYIAAAQQTDHLLMSKLDHNPLHFQWLTVALQLCLITHVKEPGESPKICIHDALLNKSIQFYHVALAHTRMA